MYPGSIGVVAQMPNIHRWLQKEQIDYLTMTAGKYKRTLTPFGEVTEEGKQKFQDDLNEIHDKFKGFVADYRGEKKLPDSDVVATGEVWLAVAGLAFGFWVFQRPFFVCSCCYVFVDLCYYIYIYI